ncbi:transcription repressor OFP8-like [Phragmites australis]|uniref:transcription repressor OFP8-like n=1 Tax=Phragmites australis TaxID=29695 RepID=UPI002D790305|nr:transcription repressor OFP8-like [Phragmites australis]
MHTTTVDKSPHRRGSAGAGSGLKQRLAQILLRSSCTTNTSTSTTAFVSLAKTNADSHQDAPPSPYFCTPCTYEWPKVDGGSRPRRHRSRSASLVHISVDCTGGAAAASDRRSVHSDAPLLQHPSLPVRDVIKKQSKGRSQTARSPSASRRHCPPSSASWGRARRPRSMPAPYSWSSSSTATDDELAPFSSDEEGGEEAETRTLFSSLSFSSDSTSDFYHTNGGNNARNSRRNTTRRATRRALPRTSDPAAPVDAFRPLVSVETKKQSGCNDKEKAEKVVRTKLGAAEETSAGMAVVKRSSNPYADFRSSMVEMVVERRIGSVGQMEELLGTYLSLNSPRHHPAILAAFEDVWEAVFGEE